MRLGVFDSGSGGLSVLKSIYEAKIFSDIIYYGDTARLPYGTKDKESIITFCLEALEFFKSQKIDLLIIACNTASAHALSTLQENAPFPVIGVIESGILAVQKSLPNLDSKLLIIATKATIASGQYQSRLQALGYRHISAIATTLFVPLVEENIFEGEIIKACMDHYFKALDFKPDGIILGCTHFPLLSKAISTYFNHQSLLIHSGEAILDYIKLHFPALKAEHTELSFYASSDIQSLKTTAKLWLNLP